MKGLRDAFSKLSEISFYVLKDKIFRFRDNNALSSIIKFYGLKEGESKEEIHEMQNFLFGMHKEDAVFPVCHGYNEWINCDDPRDFFGKRCGGSRIPPYDMMGVEMLLHTLRKKHHMNVEANDYQVPISGPAVLVGGAETNPTAGAHLALYKDYLPFQFLEEERIPSDFLPRDHPPPNFDRYYVDKEDNRYKKTSKTGKYLVDIKKYKEKEPFGPFVSPEGHIIKDILLLTILPGEKGPVTILTDAYGSAARATDILSTDRILRSVYNKVVMKPHPWLQAVFEVKVDVKENREYYRKPELLELRPLYQLPDPHDFIEKE